MERGIDYIVSRLVPFYPPQEARELAYWLIEETTGMNRFAARTHSGTLEIPNLDAIIEQLCKYVPIQYVFGHTLWLGLDLQVTPATLIPRPETAELVELVSKRMDGHHLLRVIDIGTGSGCIAMALKQRHPDWQVTGIDISAEAINVAQANARRNNLDVTFRQIDVFTEAVHCQLPSAEVIISNPPYIRPSERTTMTPNALKYEPQQALFVPEDDPLIFYRRIAELHMAPELWFEINENMGEEMRTLMQQLGYEARCLNDSYGKQRFIHAALTP